MTRGSLALGAAAVALVAGALSPLPSSGARADDLTSKKIWMLDLEAERPQRVTLGREPYLERYWFIPFTLTNKDEADHSFFLEVTARSDKKVEYRNLADPLVKEAVRKRLGMRAGGRLWTHDDLTTNHEPIDVEAPFPRELKVPAIKAGETVRCVAIFRGPDPEADRLEVAFRGLSNDVIMEKTGAPNERKLTERVLVLAYDRPGDEYHRSSDPIEYAGRKWVTVERVVKTDLD